MFYEEGTIKITQKDENDWFENYDLNFKIDTDNIKEALVFSLEINDNLLNINQTNIDGEIINEYSFKNLSTEYSKHNLPFEITINKYSSLSKRILKIYPVEVISNMYRDMYSSSPLGKDSDQLLIKIISENPKVARKYLNGLLSAFDNDGISDRQLEYKRTIEFVNDREKILKKELEVIETKKQKFKQINNLSDLSVDAGNNISLKSNYNTELFNAESQKSLANFLLESMSNSEYDYLPLNIGLEKFDINQVIIEYNNKISERNRLLVEAGPNNVIMMTLESQLNNLNQNISNSLINYINSVDLKIVKIREKEMEFEKCLQFGSRK